MSDNTVGCVLLVIVGILLVIFWPLIGVLSGAFAGWVLSGIFWWAGAWVVKGFAAFGIEIVLHQLVYIGAMLGFVGGFIKAVQTNNK